MPLKTTPCTNKELKTIEALKSFGITVVSKALPMVFTRNKSDAAEFNAFKDITKDIKRRAKQSPR